MKRAWFAARACSPIALPFLHHKLTSNWTSLSTDSKQLASGYCLYVVIELLISFMNFIKNHNKPGLYTKAQTLCFLTHSGFPIANAYLILLKLNSKLISHNSFLSVSITKRKARWVFYVSSPFCIKNIWTWLTQPNSIFCEYFLRSWVMIVKHINSTM